MPSTGVALLALKSLFFSAGLSAGLVSGTPVAKLSFIVGVIFVLTTFRPSGAATWLQGLNR